MKLCLVQLLLSDDISSCQKNHLSRLKTGKTIELIGNLVQLAYTWHTLWLLYLCNNELLLGFIIIYQFRRLKMQDSAMGSLAEE